MASATPHHLEPRREAVVVGDQVEVLIKSRERVKAHGEVFTPAHMVNQMLDLVKPELETGPDFIGKTFFEPAAGDGNFLIAILRRKLTALEIRRPAATWPFESLFALASIYGVEILQDNHAAAQSALLGEFVDFHKRHGNPCGRRTNLFQAANFIVRSNIVQGDTLTGLDANGKPIVFSWWNRVPGDFSTVQREDFSLSSLQNTAEGTLSFDFFPAYAPTRIDHVHKEA